MQTINPKTRLRGTTGDYLGLTIREYIALGKFSSALDPFGVKTTGIGKGPFGVGCLLKVSGKAGQYEVHVDGTGRMFLGRVKNDGNRVRLCEGGTNTEASWERLLQVVRNSEGRL
jgi:hypothetical protein